MGICVGIVGGVVMLCVIGVIIFIQGCPPWIIAIGERSMGGVEFIGKYERVVDDVCLLILIRGTALGLLAVGCSNFQWRHGPCVGWSVGIDPSGVTNKANEADTAAAPADDDVVDEN